MKTPLAPWHLAGTLHWTQWPVHAASSRAQGTTLSARRYPKSSMEGHRQLQHTGLSRKRSSRPKVL